MLEPSDLVGSSEFIKGMSAAARACLAQYAELREVPANGLVFHQGDDTDGLYIVRSGELRVVLRTRLLEREIAVIGPGAVLGEMSILGRDRKRKADAIATGAGATLIFLPLPGLQRLREQFPSDFATGILGLASEVVERLDRANHLLVEQLAVERSESLRRDLVMHDLRSPMALMASGVHSLMLRPDIYGPLGESQRRALERIERNLGFLRLLVDSILELERTRLTSTLLRDTSLREVLEACAAPLAGLLAPERWLRMGEEPVLAFLQGTRLSLGEAAALDHPLRADPLRLAQVLLNLIGNALRYTNGPLELEVLREGDLVAIDISDHGPGIPPELREEIFDAFKQRELQDKKLPVGKGFGLAGVREMVSSMGGTIQAHGRRDGQAGARFRIELAAARR